MKQSNKHKTKTQKQKVRNIMSTKVEPNVETPATTTLTDEESLVAALKADTTVQTDAKLVTLIGAVDNVEAKLGGKWCDVAEYLIKQKWVALTEEEEKEPSKERRAEFKHARNVILKTLIVDMDKTYKAAQSIATYITKLALPSREPARKGLRTGSMSVRESREFGRKPQSNPSVQRTDATRYAEGLDIVVRYALAQGFDSAKVYQDIGRKFAEYAKRKNEKSSDEKAAKAAFKDAIKETEKQLAKS